jgi:hypothetical protein
VEGVKTTGGTGNSFAMAAAAAAAAAGTTGGDDEGFEIYGAAGDRGVGFFASARRGSVENRGAQLQDGKWTALCFPSACVSFFLIFFCAFRG